MRMLTAYIFLLVGVALNALASIVLKLGMRNNSFQHVTFESFIKLIREPFVFFGAFLLALSFGSYILALTKINLNVVYPIWAGLSFIIIVAFAALVLKEPLSFLQAIGLALIAIGISLVAFHQ